MKIVIKDVYETLHRLGYDVEVYPRILNKPFRGDEEADEMAAYVRKHGITHLMSISLNVNLAFVAYKTDIKYVSILWDAPLFGMYSPFARIDNCFFSTFDKLDYQRFMDYGIAHVIYQPLSIDKYRVISGNEKDGFIGKNDYINDICFVGSLYEKNFFNKYLTDMPDVIIQYFAGIFENAAFKWDGVNRFSNTVSKEIVDYFKVKTPFDIADTTYFEGMHLVKKIANIERICVLNMLAEQFQVTFYTSSTGDIDKLSGVKIMPPVNPGREIWDVFAKSKINLNISLKGIEAGTPQRVMDITGAGGFALTNYCPETAELFEEDKEIVMFRSPEELSEKTAYYLSHDEERERIARAGREKTLSCYTYERKLKELLDWVEKGV